MPGNTPLSVSAGNRPDLHSSANLGLFAMRQRQLTILGRGRRQIRRLRDQRPAICPSVRRSGSRADLSPHGYTPSVRLSNGGAIATCPLSTVICPPPDLCPCPLAPPLPWPPHPIADSPSQPRNVLPATLRFGRPQVEPFLQTVSQRRLLTELLRRRRIHRPQRNHASRVYRRRSGSTTI